MMEGGFGCWVVFPGLLLETVRGEWADCAHTRNAAIDPTGVGVPLACRPTCSLSRKRNKQKRETPLHEKEA